MKLGLLGYPIEHSQSPSLYKKFLGTELTSYELYSCPTSVDVPSLEYFSKNLNGLNITSPYKKHFIGEILIQDETVQKIGAVNTLAFKHNTVIGTNTDYLAVVEILKNYLATYPSLELLLLGDGVMAKLTLLVAENLKIPVVQLLRKQHPDLAKLNLGNYTRPKIQTIVINACSRDFIFQGELPGDSIFWDYNYAFFPHESTLPLKVKTYQDGREMLELQALAAIKFWKSNH